MDTTYVTAFAALGGSMAGGLILGAATWLAQRTQARAGRRAYQMSHREDLFRDFILAASRAHGLAVMSSEPDFPEIVNMYSAINRMKVLCNSKTIERAERVARIAIETYFEPNKTLPEILGMIKSGAWISPLNEFAEAAREELRTLN